MRSSTGLLLAVTSAASFGTSGTLAAGLLASGWTPGAAVTVRVGVAAVVLTVPALHRLRGGWGRLRRAWLSLLAYGGFAVATAQLCYFNAVRHLSVAVALVLEYSGVLLVVAWLWAARGHRPRGLTIAGAGAALGGLAFVLDLFSDHRLDAVGLGWGLGAAVGLAVYYVLSASADAAVLPPLVTAWAGLTIGAVVLGAAAAVGAIPVHATRLDVTFAGTRVAWWLPVVGLALVAAVLAYVAGIAAARALGAKVASFVGLTEVLFAVLFAWALLGQALDAAQLAGAVLVVAGITLVRVDELRESALARASPRPVEFGEIPPR